MSACSQSAPVFRTILQCDYAELCYRPTERNPVYGARVLLVPSLGKSGIGRLFLSYLTFYDTPCKAVLEAVPEPVEGRGFKPKIFDNEFGTVDIGSAVGYQESNKFSNFFGATRATHRNPAKGIHQPKSCSIKVRSCICS